MSFRAEPLRRTRGCTDGWRLPRNLWPGSARMPGCRSNVDYGSLGPQPFARTRVRSGRPRNDRSREGAARRIGRAAPFAIRRPGRRRAGAGDCSSRSARPPTASRTSGTRSPARSRPRQTIATALRVSCRKGNRATIRSEPTNLHSCWDRVQPVAASTCLVQPGLVRH